MIRQLIPLALSANTLVLMWLVGNKRVLGWVLGLAGQVVWFVFIVVFEAWGLLPLAVGLTFVYARNLVLWRWSWIRRDLRGWRKPSRVTHEKVFSESDVRVAHPICVNEPIGWTWEHPPTGYRSPMVFESKGDAWLAIGAAYQESAVVVPVRAGDYFWTGAG